MKIEKTGTFDENGLMVGWHLNGEGLDSGDDASSILAIINNKVFVHGVEIVDWTNERLRKMVVR